MILDLFVNSPQYFVCGGRNPFCRWQLGDVRELESLAHNSSERGCVSSIIYSLLWNGQMQRLANQGAIAILINLAILFVLFHYAGPNLKTGKDLV